MMNINHMDTIILRSTANQHLFISLILKQKKNKHLVISEALEECQEKNISRGEGGKRYICKEALRPSSLSPLDIENYKINVSIGHICPRFSNLVTKLKLFRRTDGQGHNLM